jgi:hypothetical protein
MRTITCILLTAVLLLTATSCGGGNNPFSPDPDVTPNELIGDWQGTYQNDVVGVGTIQVSFFMDGSTLKVTYDLQGGEVVGTSSVSISDIDITFIGVGTKLQQVTGEVWYPATKITGTLIIDYTLSGIRSGPVTLTKI